jgi:hypothetical protein
MSVTTSAPDPGGRRCRVLGLGWADSAPGLARSVPEPACASGRGGRSLRPGRTLSPRRVRGRSRCCSRLGDRCGAGTGRLPGRRSCCRWPRDTRVLPRETRCARASPRPDRSGNAAGRSSGPCLRRRPARPTRTQTIRRSHGTSASDPGTRGGPPSAKHARELRPGQGVGSGARRGNGARAGHHHGLGTLWREDTRCVKHPSGAGSGAVRTAVVRGARRSRRAERRRQRVKRLRVLLMAGCRVVRGRRQRQGPLAGRSGRTPAISVGTGPGS